jgi:GTP cyclohydrolase II
LARAEAQRVPDRPCRPPRPAAERRPIDVERAIAEIRAGRPVILRDAATCALVVAVDALDAALAALLPPASTRLALTAPRLRRLGVATREACALEFAELDLDRLATLAVDPDARLAEAPHSATSSERGALELMRLAQALPAAVVSEAPAADGAFAGLLGVELADVTTYRRDCAAALRIVARASVPLDGAADAEFVVFRGGEGLRGQTAIIIGKPDFAEPVSVRLHSACLTGDLFGSLKCDCGDQLRHAARHFAENGGGVLLYLDQEGRGNGLGNKILAYDLQAHGFDTYDADEALGFEQDGRRFEFAAAMLKALGAQRVRLLTNSPEKIAALGAAGLEVVADQRVMGRRNAHNERYLAAKRDKAGHLIDLDRAPRANGRARSLADPSPL